tara:strand:+ start:1933 stop:2283 length:351 start_codon:yes stop_codon:yes gene_type:complete
MVSMDNHLDPRNSKSRMRKLSKLNVTRYAISKYNYDEFTSNDLAYFIRHGLDSYGTEMNVLCGKSSSTRKGWAVQRKVGALLHTLHAQGLVTRTSGRDGHTWHKTQKSKVDVEPNK